MADPLVPLQRHTSWGQIRKTVAAVLKWSPSFTPKFTKFVNWGFIVFFGIDTLLVIFIQFHWIDRRWQVFRRWEDLVATIFMLVWVLKEIERRRAKSRELRQSQ